MLCKADRLIEGVRRAKLPFHVEASCAQCQAQLRLQSSELLTLRIREEKAEIEAKRLCRGE